MINTLFSIIIKNLRLVFRNWTSFLLLVLGPLFLILIIGFAFSSETLHDISIGVHAPLNAGIQDIVDALESEEVSIVYFHRIDTCIRAMTHYAVTLCADFSSDFGNATGSITFYYDTTRYNLVHYILEYLKDKVAISSEQISLELAEQVFFDIKQFVTDMETGQQQVHDLQKSALILQEDLVTAHNDVVLAQDAFLPQYMKIKDMQHQLNQTVFQYSEQYSKNANRTLVLADLVTERDTLVAFNTSVAGIQDTLSAATFFSNFTYNETLFTGVYDSVTETTVFLDSSIKYLNATMDLTTLTINQTTKILQHIDLIVGYLDAMNLSLAETEQKLRFDIENIDRGIQNLEGLSASFDVYIAKFSSINETTAEKFLHPITASFQPLPSEYHSKTALVFPIILIFMLSFISILLSNMLVLNEAHSHAYFRSFLIPINNLFFILGLFITTLLLIGFQLLVFFVVAYVSFGVNFFMNLPVFLLSVLLATMLYVLVGMFFGYLVKQRQTSLLMSLFFSLIMFFFSDVILPLEIMPRVAAFIAQFNPLVVAEDLFRQTLFFGHGIREQLFGFGVLGIYIVFFSVLVIAAYYWNRKRQ